MDPRRDPRFALPTRKQSAAGLPALRRWLESRRILGVPAPLVPLPPRLWSWLWSWLCGAVVPMAACQGLA